MPEVKDPFYVGYLPLPDSLRRSVRAFAIVGVVGAIAMAAVIASRQQDPGVGRWDTARTFAIEGHLSVDPYPIIHVSDEGGPGSRAVILVSSMKFGARDRAIALAGKRVRAKGHFITRGGRGVFELLGEDDALTVLDGESSPPEVEILGEQRLVGEITDSKCFLGVMKPGFGKTHRACAARCISGGIPPILVTRSAKGEALVFLLKGLDGRAMKEEVLPYVSEPVEVHGRLARHGDLLVLAIDPKRIVRK